MRPTLDQLEARLLLSTIADQVDQSLNPASAVAAVQAGGNGATVKTASTSSPVAPQETLNVQLQSNVSGALSRLMPLLTAAGATAQPTLISGLYEVSVASSQVSQLASELSASTLVQYASPMQMLHIADVPNDPQYLSGNQWALNGVWGINAPMAWNTTTGSNSVIVADVDTGMDYNHPDLISNTWINQTEIPSAVLSNLTDVNGDGLITFTDLSNPVNQGSGKIVDTNGDGVITGADLIAPTSVGGWADGSTQDSDASHPDDLIGWNFVNNTNNPMDDFSQGHGTHTAGIIGAVGNNGIGVAGTNWTVQIMPVEFLDSTGSGSDVAAAESIDYAVDHGAKVINASWGGSGSPDPTITAALQYANSKGVIFVAAAGNNGQNIDNNPFQPASEDLPNMIVVAAIGSNGALPSWSNYGVNSVQLAAPGVSIISTLPNDNYGYLSGTSMAAPYVTGTVALVEAAHPTWSMSQVIDAVLDHTTSDSSLAGQVTTGGVVNAAAAVANTDGPRITAATPSGSINNASGFSTVQVTFDEEVNPATLTSSQATLTSPSGMVTGLSISAVVGSNNHQFNISFPSQTATGTYTLVVGPDIQDWYGNDMNQNRNGINGEAMDAFTDTIFQTSPGASDLLSVSSPSTTDIAGTVQRFTVTALSPGGGTDIHYTGTIQLGSTDPQAAIPSSYTFTTADAGAHTFTVTLKTSGVQSVTATDTINQFITGAEENIWVQPASADSLTVTGFPTSDTAGGAHGLTVTAYDQFGNVATGYTGIVKFTSSDPKAVLPASFNFTPEDEGSSSFTTTLETAGTQTITATDTTTTSVTGTELNIIVQSTAANSLTVTGIPTSDTAGTIANVTVTAFDQFGNIATGYTGTVLFSSSDLRAALPAQYSFTAGDAGTHIFSATLKTTGTRYLTVTDTTTTSISGTESGITVKPATANSLTATGMPTIDTAGTTNIVTITAYDQFSNVATGYTGTVKFTSSDLQAMLPANYIFTSTDAGSHTFSITLSSVGTQSISVTDLATATIAGSVSVTVIPAASASASLIKRDTSTEGTWIGVYGSQGYNIIGNSTSYPSYASVTAASALSVTWAPSTTDPRALQNSSGIGRVAAAWYSSTSFMINVNLTDGQTHDLSLYALDWDGNNSRSEQIQLTSAATGTVLDTEKVSSFSQGVYLQWAVTGNVVIKVSKLGGANAVLSGLFFDTPSTSGTSASDIFNISSPSTTDTVSTAQSFTVTALSPTGGTDTQYSGTIHFKSSDLQAVLPANYTFTSTDAGVHTFSITFNTVGTQSITATDMATATITGSISVTVNPAVSSSATLLKRDTTTEGNWIGVYGSQGYNIIGNATSYPSYATVTTTGALSYTWAPSTTDPRALQYPIGTGRIAATWYSSTSFTINVNLTDGQTHDLTLYALDWDGNNTRSEQIQITSAATGAVLETEKVSAFSQGVYLQWAVTGNVVIKVSKLGGANAVLSGLFFDTPSMSGAAAASFLNISNLPAVDFVGTINSVTPTTNEQLSGRATDYTSTKYVTSSDSRAL
jgi:subtilisin family serine protease